MEQLKACTKCKLALPLTAFTKQSDNKDGLAYRCKACAKEYKQQYLQKNRERVRTKAREMSRLGLWGSRPKKSPTSDQDIDGDPLSGSGDQRRKAVRAVYVALRNGTITKLHCQCCGAYNTEAHHADYSLPLAVTWLCKKCHCQLHNEHRDRVRYHPTQINTRPAAQ